MSTEIKSAYGSHLTLEMRKLRDGLVNLTFPAVSSGIAISPADLLAAIEAEGIGVVVPGTLPPVTVEGDETVASGQYTVWRDDRESDLAYAHALIAAHRHFDANPPAPEVDEADVEALVALTTEIDRSCDAKRAARNAIASGRVTVTR